jgi:CRISPR/Cas system-associated protein Cas5 (RAMP superfamily)
MNIRFSMLCLLLSVLGYPSFSQIQYVIRFLAKGENTVSVSYLEKKAYKEVRTIQSEGLYNKAKSFGPNGFEVLVKEQTYHQLTNQSKLSKETEELILRARKGIQ